MIETIKPSSSGLSIKTFQLGEWMMDDVIFFFLFFLREYKFFNLLNPHLVRGHENLKEIDSICVKCTGHEWVIWLDQNKNNWYIILICTKQVKHLEDHMHQNIFSHFLSAYEEILFLVSFPEWVIWLDKNKKYYNIACPNMYHKYYITCNANPIIVMHNGRW